MDYGELLEEGYHPQQDYVYTLMVNYFKNPIMTKIKNQNQFSMYACKIYGLLSNEYRYLIVFTHINGDAVGVMEKLDSLKWINLQTRTLSEILPCKTHSYQPNSETPLNVAIKKVSVSKQSSYYKCLALPVAVDLLHTAKKDSSSYQNEGTMVAALETYETIVSFV